MRKYEIIIKVLETGETLTKVKANCIIGAFSQDDGVQSIGLSCSTGMEILLTINGAEKVIKSIKENSRLDNPIADLLTRLMTVEKDEDDDE